MGSSDSDSDADKKKKVGKKRIVRKNRKNDDDDNFLKGDKPASEKDGEKEVKKRRKKVSRSKSPSKKKRGGDDDDDDSDDDNTEPLMGKKDKSKSKKKKKKKKKKKGESSDEEDSGSDLEKEEAPESGLKGLFGKFGKKANKTTKDDTKDGSDEDDGGDDNNNNKSKKESKTKSKKESKKKSKEDEDEDSDEDGAADGDKKKAKKSKKNDRKKAKSNASNNDTATEEEEDSSDDESGGKTVDKKTFSIGNYTFSVPSFGRKRAKSKPDWKMPRPEFYKDAMRDWTFPGGVGLRKLPHADPEASDKPLPKSYAGCAADDVISILVTQMDNLVDDPVIVHPMVRIHVVDVTTGKYLNRVKRKGQKQDSSTTQFEKQTILPLGVSKKRQPNKKCGFIPPVCTLPWRLSGVRGANPQWQEQVAILESYTTILSEKALLLFEVLDFGPTVPLEEARKGEGYYRIAWGFLKTRGGNGQIRVGVRELPKDAKPDTNKEYFDYSRELAESQKICRLQLYKYQNDSALVRSQAYYRGLPAFVPAPATPEVPRVFLQYLRQNRVPYASSITMVIGPISKPRSAIVLRRPAVPWEQEKHRMKFQQMATNMAGAGEGGVGGAMDKDKAEVVRRGVMLRSRKPTESCLLPNKLLHRLGAGKEGALVCKFNNSGTLIAVACCNGDEFPVRIYDSEGGGLRHEFLGHHSIVYDLQWSLNDHYLVSACGDGTSKVFCLGSLGQKSKKGEESEEEGVGEGEEEEESGASEAEESGEDENDDTSNSTGSSGGVKKKKRKGKKLVQSNIQGRPFLVATLQHMPPVFLYAACFQPPAAGKKHDNDLSPPMVLTGSFDHAIRLWDPSTGQNLGLLGGKRYHDSHVNAMVFDHKTGRLYSGDGEGCIVIWRKAGQGKVSSGEDYVVMRKIDKLRELKGRAIVSLNLNPARPTGRGHILIMAHENTLRVFDLSTQRLTEASYSGADNHDSIVRACYSACGKYVVAGTDQGAVMVWDSKSGLRISSELDSIQYAAPLNSVCWHPTQHVVAVSSYGGDFPVLMYSADRDPSRGVELVEEGGEVEGGERGEGGEKRSEEEERERKELLEEKRRANRERYAELKAKAMQRRGEE